MKSILKLFIAILIASSSSAFFLIEKAEVAEAKTCPIGEYPKLISATETKCTNPVSEDNAKENVNEIQAYVLTFLKTLMVFSSAVSALLIVLAGYSYMGAEGNARTLEEAKNNLIRAGVGVLVLACSFTIMNLIENVVGFLP